MLVSTPTDHQLASEDTGHPLITQDMPNIVQAALDALPTCSLGTLAVSTTGDTGQYFLKFSYVCCACTCNGMYDISLFCCIDISINVIPVFNIRSARTKMIFQYQQCCLSSSSITKVVRTMYRTRTGTVKSILSTEGTKKWMKKDIS